MPGNSRLKKRRGGGARGGAGGGAGGGAAGARGGERRRREERGERKGEMGRGKRGERRKRRDAIRSHGASFTCVLHHRAIGYVQKRCQMLYDAEGGLAEEGGRSKAA